MGYEIGMKITPVAFALIVLMTLSNLAFAGGKIIVNGFYAAKVTGFYEEQGPNETTVIRPLTKAKLCQLFFVKDPSKVEVVVGTDGAYLADKVGGAPLGEIMKFDTASGFSLDLPKIEKFAFATTFFGDVTSKGIARGTSKIDKKNYLRISASAVGFSNNGAPRTVAPRAFKTPQNYIIKIKFTPYKRFVVTT